MLSTLCQQSLIQILKGDNYDPRQINDLCKYVPDYLLEPILEHILEEKVVTDIALLAFLVPSRVSLKLINAVCIRNSTIKQISFNCPNLVCVLIIITTVFLFMD